MFKTTISQTPFYNASANSIFSGKIDGYSYNGDTSFVSTLRALVFPKIKESEDTIWLNFMSSNYSASLIRDNRPTAVLGAMYRESDYSHGSIIIRSIEGENEGNDLCFEIIEERFVEQNTGFIRINKVTDFFRKSFKVLCYVNEADKKVALFVEKLNTRRMHYLQCAIFAFLPWYFKPEDGVTQDEMDLIQSLRETTCDRYNSALRKLAEPYDFRAELIKRSLSGFEVAYETQRRDSIKRDIEDYIYQIDEAKSRIESALRQKHDAETTLLGLELKISDAGSQESEIMEYFLCNKKLFLQSVNGIELTFVVKDYLTYFDEEMAKTVINNRRSYVYDPGAGRVSDIITPEDMKMLMNEIFVEQNLRIKMCCAYRIRLGRRTDGLNSYDYGSDFDDCIPNPHIDRYSCLGDYERTMNERLIKNDIIGVIEQCMASCKSLNFADSAVMTVFMSRLYGKGNYRRNRCIELPNGDVVTAVDAVKWLKSQKNDEE